MALSFDYTGDNSSLLSELDQDNQRAQRFRRWFDQSTQAIDGWRTDAIESREFVSGEQYKPGDLEILKAAKRPALVINKILAPVLFLAGVQRQQRQEPQILPFEGGDAKSADLMSALYKYVGMCCREQVVDSAVFMDKIVTGLGFWKAYVKFDKDIEGEICWERIDPLAVFPDPNWLDSGWENAEYVIQATWMGLEQAINEFPDHQEEIRKNYGEWLTESTSLSGRTVGSGEFAGDSLSDRRLWWDAETKRLRVLEVWYKQRTRIPVGVDKASNKVIADPAEIAAMQADPMAAQNLAIVPTPVTRIYCAHILNEILLDDGPSPYKTQEFPIFPTRGYYWWKKPFGIVQPAKDLQREKNKRRSTITEIVTKSTLSGWMNPRSGGAKTEDLERFSAGVGKVINYDTTPPVPIPAPELPQALVFLDASSDRDMQGVTNINAELLGNTTQRTVSGRAIRARQDSGLVVQEPMLGSFGEDKEPAARFVIGLIQQFISIPKAARILGTLVMRQQAQVGAGAPGEPLPPMTPEAEIMQSVPDLGALQELFQGAFDQRYDVVIGQKPWQPSIMQQRLSTLMDLVEKFGDWLPPDMLVEAGKDAGIFTESQAQRTNAYVQQKMQLLMQQQAMASAGQAPAPPSNSGG